jgi:hypothetical protein
MHTRRSHDYFCLLSLFLAFERALLSYHTSRCSQPYGTSTQNTSRSPSWYFWNYDFLLSDGLSSSPFPAISYGHLQPIVLPGGWIRWIQLQARQPLTGQGWEGIPVAAHNGDGVAEFEQKGHQLAPHKTRAAQQQQTHRQLPDRSAGRLGRRQGINAGQADLA